jgi:regulator of nucleoside diphosphate kinase
MKKHQEKNPVIMIEEDYEMLRRFVRNAPQDDEMSLAYELSRAIIVKKEAFPPNAVRLNSRVSVLDLETEKVMEFTLVLPHEADIQQRKVSILTPMGTALIGFRKAEEVRWKVPAGLKRFRILDVVNKAA